MQLSHLLLSSLLWLTTDACKRTRNRTSTYNLDSNYYWFKEPHNYKLSILSGYNFFVSKLVLAFFYLQYFSSRGGAEEGGRKVRRERGRERRRNSLRAGHLHPSDA